MVVGRRAEEILQIIFEKNSTIIRKIQQKTIKTRKNGSIVR